MIEVKMLNQIELGNHFLLGRVGKVMDSLPDFSNLVPIQSLIASPLQSVAMVAAVPRVVNLRLQQRNLYHLILDVRRRRSQLLGFVKSIDDPNMLRRFVALQVELIDKLEELLQIREQVGNGRIKRLLFPEKVHRVVVQELRDAKHDLRVIVDSLNPATRDCIEQIVRECFWFRLGDQAKIVIDNARKSLKEKLRHNKLGDMTFSFSEEEKKEMIEDAKLAQASLYKEEV